MEIFREHDRLGAMADLWISHSGGLVKAVILISVERQAFKVIFEKWIPGVAIPTNAAMCEQETVMP